MPPIELFWLLSYLSSRFKERPRRGRRQRQSALGTMSSARILEVVLPPGSVGVGIRKAKDGSCYVHSVIRSDGEISNPLRVGDVILQLNSAKLGGSQGGSVRDWVKMFAAFASSSKKLLVRRQVSSGDTVSESVAAQEEIVKPTDVGPSKPPPERAHRVSLSPEKGCPPAPASQLTNHSNESGGGMVPEKATSFKKDLSPKISQPTSRSNDHALGRDDTGKSLAEKEADATSNSKPEHSHPFETMAAILSCSVDEIHAKIERNEPNPPKKKKKKLDPSEWRPGMSGRPSKEAKLAYAKTAKGRKELAERGISVEDTTPRAPNVAPSPLSAIRRVRAHYGKTDDDARTAKVASDDIEEPSEDEMLLALPKTQEDREKSRRAGWVPPIDLIALNAQFSYETKHCYEYLFREYKHISSRFKSLLRSVDDPGIFSHQLEKEGLCTRIMDSNFEMWLPPSDLPRDRLDGELFPVHSLIHRFAALVWNMLGACKGDDPCMTADVISAAVNDISGMSSDQDQLEHLIGVNMAIDRHGLKDLMDKGEPAMIKKTFGKLAKAWKKLLDPDYDRRRCDASEELWEFSEGTCLVVQFILQRAKKTKGHDAPKYNFNYRRIPRPKRTKEGQLRKKEEDKKRKAEGSGSAGTAKKKKKTSPMDDLIDRIIAVEGVDLTGPVYDSCETVKSKIRAFLARDGMTKASLCRALGGINNNSLNKFLQASGQDQKGNETYTKAYCFFEKLRKLEGKPKSSDREMTEKTMPDGFDITKDSGGRPSYIIGGSYW